MEDRIDRSTSEHRLMVVEMLRKLINMGYTEASARKYAENGALSELKRDPMIRRRETQELVDKFLQMGFTAKSAAEYAKTGDVDVLEHTGYVSMQLYKPNDGTETR